MSCCGRNFKIRSPSGNFRGTSLDGRFIYAQVRTTNSETIVRKIKILNSSPQNFKNSKGALASHDRLNSCWQIQAGK